MSLVISLNFCFSQETRLPKVRNLIVTKVNWEHKYKNDYSYIQKSLDRSEYEGNVMRGNSVV